jgi:DNA-binding GntR family transcriptional regulator
VGATGNVDRIYENVKRMTSGFDLKPDEKLKEQAMARKLGASRTPLREALNRLVSEGFLKYENGRGFFCRSLGAAQILELYQAREAVECKLVELACLNASSEDFTSLEQFLKLSENDYHENMSGAQLVAIDEAFHIRIAELSNNRELIRILENLNARVRFVRTIDLEERRVVTPGNHAQILQMMINNQVPEAVEQMRLHIVRSYEEASEAVRKAYMRIYVPDEVNKDDMSKITVITKQTSEI